MRVGSANRRVAVRAVTAVPVMPERAAREPAAFHAIVWRSPALSGRTERRPPPSNEEDPWLTGNGPCAQAFP